MDKLIRWFTRSKYSHCELLFEDGRMFSADAWNGGVRWNTKYVLGNWDIITIEMSDYAYTTLVKWCVSKESSAYDWWGVIRFVLPFVKQDPSKWFCSELCAAGLRFVGGISLDTKVHKLSPGDLHTQLMSSMSKVE